MNIVAIIQARTGSTRLPGKILLPLAGKELLARMLERVAHAAEIDRLIVATTWNQADDEVVKICRREGFPCFRGHETDLLDRHFRAASDWAADAVVKIPSDCPLIDPRVIDRVISLYRENSHRFDYVSNLHPPTYPDGNDVEVMSMSVLETAWREAEKNFEREHTTPFIWDRPERFHIGNVSWEVGKDYSKSHRWTIDYLEDYRFIKAVYEHLYNIRPDFGLHDILALLIKHRHIAAINRKYAGVNWYRSHLKELRTKSAADTRQLPEEPIEVKNNGRKKSA